MKKFIIIFFFIIWINPLHTQTYYDSNDLKYYLDFSNKIANLKFQEYKIKGPIEEINSFNGNRYTLIKGDSIHWLLQQSTSKNKYLSYLILKGEYKDLVKLAKRESSMKKLEVIKSDRIFSGYFKDYFNFVNEFEYEKINRDRLIGEYIQDAGLTGKYKIKIYRDNGVNYFNLDINGYLELSKKDIVIETNLPTLTKFTGTYDADLNTNLEFIKKGIIAGRISLQDRAIFSLNFNLEKKMGTLKLLEVEVDDDGEESIKRKTTTFTIEE